MATQAAACAAAALLTEGMRRSSRAVSRERLVESVEAVREFRTDSPPPLSYGPDRRVGALGGHVVALEAGGTRFRIVRPWLQLD